jgi:hypothetical protein
LGTVSLGILSQLLLEKILNMAAPIADRWPSKIIKGCVIFGALGSQIQYPHALDQISAKPAVRASTLSRFCALVGGPARSG